MELRREGCVFDVTPEVDPLVVTDAISAQVVTMPALDLLVTAEMRWPLENGKYTVKQMRPLPNGGIGGKDVCDAVQAFNLIPPDAVNPVVQWVGVRLRGNLDLVDEYPSTGKLIKAREQILTLPAGRYAVLDGNSQAVRGWWRRAGTDWAKGAGGDMAYVIGPNLFVKIAD